MSRRPTLVGLTGSIGMGKSTAAAMFRAEGVPVFDSDAAVRVLQGAGGRLVPAIEALFPGTTGVGGVDRAALGGRVIGDRASLRLLERLVHPVVAAERRAFVRRHAARDVLVLDVPLLFEARIDRLVDMVVVVSAPAPVQRARVLDRPGMTASRLAAILARQLPDREKRRRADLVLETGRGRGPTRTAIRRLLACLRAHPGRYSQICARSSSTPKPRG